MTGIAFKRFLLFLLVAFVAMIPNAAEACPVCFQAKEGSRVAFIVTTVFMSVLPWMLVGGFVMWYRSQTASEGEQTEESNPE